MADEVKKSKLEVVPTRSLMKTRQNSASSAAISPASKEQAPSVSCRSASAKSPV